ncbi:MAG: ABC transporter permease [Acidimicrobiia bacterium]|jgi:simple sugar transport system permease protein
MTDMDPTVLVIDTAPEYVEENRWRRLGEMVILYVLSIGGAVAVSGLLVAVTGNSWIQMFKALLDGAFLAPGRWGDTLVIAAPMLLVALGMVVGVKAGFFNIGQEGQLLMGALAMAWVGTKLAGPGPLLLVLGLVMAFAAGGGYAGLSAIMRFRRGVPEVISTLLLVFIALQIVGYAVTTDWLLRDLDATGPSRAISSAALGEDTRLPVIRIFGNEFNLGILIGVVLALILAFALTRTVWGFRIRLLGHNPNVAQKIGVSARRTGSLALFLSGGFAGLAGAVMLTGGSSGFRLTTGFSQNIGWQGLLVALLAASRPLVAIPMAVLFAALRTGSGFLAATGVDRKIVDVVQALLLLALLVPPAIQFIRDRKKARARATREA